LKLVILVLGVAMAIPLGCSEKVVNDPTPDFGDANIVIEIQLAPEDSEQLIGTYRLTVTAPDMDTVVADMTVIGGTYVVGAVEVPVGDRRRFVLEGIRGPASGSPVVIYRGEATADVRPISVLTLDIVLLPVAPLAKLWPGTTIVPPAGNLSLDLKLYNLPAISGFAIMMEWDDRIIRLNTAVPDPSLGDNVTFVEYHPNESNSPVAMLVSDTTGAPIVDARGHATLASLEFTSQVVVGELPFSIPINITSAQAVGPESDTLISGIDFFVEEARVGIVTVPELEISFPDPVLEGEIRRVAELPTTGAIMLSDVIHLTYLSVADLPVSNLAGIQYLINLRTLNISWTPTGDANLLYVAPLLGLQSFSAEDCALTTLLPLTVLNKLTALDVDVNFIDDISVVADMSGMYWFSASSNLISDISPLADLDELSYIYVSGNLISDLTPLQNLPNLYRIELHDNFITDVGPLVANPGIDNGDQITIYGNPVAVTNDPVQQGYFAQLQARGVTVIFGI
jgi:Leucine-rich repeat (LRR) protein